MRRAGNTIDLGLPDNEPMSPRLRVDLKREFSYTKREMKPKGRKMEMEFTEVCLLQEEGNRFLTSYGLADSIKRFCKERDIVLAFQEFTPEAKNAILLKPDYSILENYTLRNRQDDCIRAFDERKHGIINAPVGFGKTFLMGILTQLYPTAKFHIVTKAVTIAKRIYADLLRLTPNVGMVGGGHNIPDKRITVFTADSLGKSDGNADFLIWDECHQAAAPSYLEKIVKLYRYSRNYGFSATPTGRSDGGDRLLNLLFGDVIFEMNYEEAQDKGLVVPITVRWLDNREVPVRALNYSQRTSLERYCIWNNQSRNELIANDVAENYTDDDQILILVGRVEHAVNLGKHLPDFTLVYGSMTDEDCRYYKSRGLLPDGYKPITNKDRDRIKEEFISGKIKRVIATDVWNTGFDCPSLRVVYNVSARGSSILTTQGGGRVSRIFTGKEGGTVVDVVDIFSGNGACFYNAALKRKKNYTSLGWTQEGWPNGRR